MDMKDFYEESYRREGSINTSELAQRARTFSKGMFNFIVESKGRFLPSRDWGNISALEMGGGRGGVSLLLSELGARATLVDFSPSALEQAKSIFSFEGKKVKTICADVGVPDLKFSDQFDLVVDSHLLHCLTTDPERSSYYRLVFDHLSDEGIFVAETMVHRKNMLLPEGFMLDEESCLWQLLGDWVPVRKILDSLDLEQELLGAGFEILYFYYYGKSGLAPHKSFHDLPPEILPAVVRFVARKKTHLGG